MVYARIELGVANDGTTKVWKVTDRRPILRSTGHSADDYAARVTANALDAGKAIYSEELPKPWANLNDAVQGDLPAVGGA